MRAEIPKFGYYIGLMTAKEQNGKMLVDMRFVTKINHGPKTFEYKTYEEIVRTDDLRPVVLNQTEAREFAYRLMWNGYAPTLIPDMCFPALNPEDRRRCADITEKEVSE